MRIDSVRVGSYGAMMDRGFVLGPGLNLFYGPNEAGKSTLRSFVTTTVFPKASLKYPTQKGSDSGSVAVTLLNGDVLVFQKEGRRSSGLGAELCNIDDREYLSVYSLAPEDLRDVKGIEKGEIRNRFLTVPGGADLPHAYETLDEERTKLLPDTKRSAKCEIAMLMRNEHELAMTVKRLQARESGDNHYSELAAKRNALKDELEKTNAKLRVCDENRTAAQRMTGRAEDFANLEKLAAREKELAYAEKTDAFRMRTLDSEIKRYSEELGAAAAELDILKKELNGSDPETFVRNKNRIERLNGMSAEYDFYRKQSEIRKKADKRRPAKHGFPTVPAIGAAVAVAGIIAAVFADAYAGAAAVAAGSAIAVLGSVRKKPASVSRNQYGTEDERIRYIEGFLEDIAKETGIERNGFRADTELLVFLLGKSKEYESADRKYAETEEKLTRAKEAAELYLAGFGGREGYDRAAKDSEELKAVRSKLEILRECTSRIEPGTAPDEETARNEYESVSEEQRRLLGELAGTEQMLKDIGSDVSVEEAITARSDAEDAVYAASYRWARLMLEKLILDEATSDAYGNGRPEVMNRADAYLSAMTDGRYRLNTDPRIAEISIVDNATSETKTAKEWSCGLEDQVKLAIKMSVALNLSREKPPVILDDVLLTSDSGRKANACKALSLLAEEIQVLYFTCDRETRDLIECSGAVIHDL